MPNKKALRSFYRAKRNTLSNAELTHASTAILERIIDGNLIREGLVMLYLDSSNHHEIPMEKWFDTLEEHPICVPKVVDANGKMEAVMWEKGMPLKPNQWGIMEPTSTSYVNPKNIATIVIPLLCFDQRGHRVGYGKGYYDRFLSRCIPRCKTIGVSCFAPVDRIEDTETTDVPLGIVVTPQQVHSF